jgi:arsenate reductase (glutaredoxin)
VETRCSDVEKNSGLRGSVTMAEILFFEKPGCINNEKQKKILRSAGHTLHCRDILKHPWDTEKLLPFVEGKKAEQMINTTAPVVKNGSLDPSKLSFTQAIALMIEDPILIKRPLIEVDGLHIQGFESILLKPYLGNWDGSEDVLTCPNLQTTSCDEKGGEI